VYCFIRVTRFVQLRTSPTNTTFNIGFALRRSDTALTEWIGAINRVAATTSAPPLPAPVTSAHMGFRVSGALNIGKREGQVTLSK
jgi:hypothetical protein